MCDNAVRWNKNETTVKTKAKSGRWGVIKRMKVLNSIMRYSTLFKAQCVSLRWLNSQKMKLAWPHLLCSHGVHVGKELQQPGGAGGVSGLISQLPRLSVIFMHVLFIFYPVLSFHCAIQCSTWTNKWPWSLIIWPKLPLQELEQTRSKLCFTAW